jgi:hypothetical protein
MKKAHVQKWQKPVNYCFLGGDDFLSMLKNFTPNPLSFVQTIWPLTLTSFPFLNGNTSESI